MLPNLKAMPKVNHVLIKGQPLQCSLDATPSHLRSLHQQPSPLFPASSKFPSQLDHSHPYTLSYPKKSSLDSISLSSVTSFLLSLESQAPQILHLLPPIPFLPFSLWTPLQGVSHLYHSNRTAFIKVTNDLYIARSNEQLSFPILLGLTTEFDTVWHPLLLETLDIKF